MYCDKCKLSYPNNIKSCPKCKKNLIRDIELDNTNTMHKRRNKKNNTYKEDNNERIKKINRLYLVWMISISIYCILESILSGKIYDYSNKFVRYSPSYISILVAFFMIRRAKSEYTILKKTLFNNIVFIILMIVFSIITTLYISKPMMKSFFYGTYLYKEYWVLYIINNLVTIILGSILLLNKNYNFTYKPKDINEKVFKYPFLIAVILLLILTIIDIVKFYMK